MLNICYESTKNCNLNCDYCITSDNTTLKGNDNYENIIEFISKLNPERIVISGGEPLLDPLLTNKLTLISNKLPNTYISLSTNGAVENYSFESILDYIDCVDFSLPSIDKKEYEIMRGLDCIDIVKNNIEHLIELINETNKNIDIRISYTLTKLNQNSLADVLNYAKKINVNSFRIGRFFPFRNAKNVEHKYSLTDEEIKKILSGYDFNSYSFKITKPIENLELMENGYVTINYLGDIFYPTRDGKKHIANITNANIEELIQINEKQQLIFNDIDVKPLDYRYKKFISHTRTRKSNSTISRTQQDEFNSDRTRIIYSSSFRRLQQKAQVFSLEKNSNVRSRLTHSLEVSDVGRILATRITEHLTKINGAFRLEADDCSKIISIVENACLIHDLGNPPFGHFGEDAIKKWWLDNKDNYISRYNLNAAFFGENSIDMNNSETQRLQKDFELFDGNPQGFRIITRLYSFNDTDNQEIESGLNLTYSTLMCALKYVGCSDNLNPNQLKNESICKKPGYFVSEKRIVEHIYKVADLPMGNRFPFTYIMEAADDIAYCLSDIADGIEKNVISIPQFVNEFINIWKNNYNQEVPEEILPLDLLEKLKKNEIKDFNTNVSSRWASYISDEVISVFVNNIQDYMSGTASEIITTKNMKKSAPILSTLKTISNKIIYRSPEAEAIEVAGFSIVSGLLDFFGRLLTLPMKHFQAFVYNQADINLKKKYAYEFRIYNMLSKRCVESYKHQIKEWTNDTSNKINIENIEWWLRVHLLIDHISGMTDDYALQTYQLSRGIDIKIG